MLEVIVLSLAAILNLVLGLVVYLKNPRGATNRFFLALTGAIVAWSVVNYISVHPVFLSQLFWVRLTLFCGGLLNLSVFLTFLAFPSSVLPERYRKLAKAAAIATLIIVPLTLTPLVFKDLRVVNGSAEPIPSPGIALFLLHTIGLLGASVFTLIKKYKSSQGKTKNQLRLVLFGLAGTFSLIVISNFLLVIILNITALVPLGSLFTLIFSGSLAYAIVKHRLFDIRAAVARSLAYLLSLGFIGLIYGVLAFGVSTGFTREAQLTMGQRMLYVAFALLTALFFQPLKRFFDRVTNRIFYQDAYDTQALIDQLNRVLVSNVELESLVRKSAEVIEANLKAEFVVFNIRSTAYTKTRNIGSRPFELVAADLETLHAKTPSLHRRAIVTDELIDDTENADLYKTLDSNNIAILTRLVATLKYDVEGIGYLMLGPKKSGNPYSEQDLKIIRILTNELVIAIENALRFEEIEQFNITLQEKVDSATKQLRHTNDKLKAMDETKDEFISMASHQLRTPLTSIKGYLSMVLEGDAGNIGEMQRKLLDQAFVSSQRMVYLIADLLNVSRLHTGKFVIEPVPSHLADVVEGEVGQLKETAAGRGLKLTYEKPADFPELFLDETKIRQVIMNFTDNAIYYTPSGGQITVRLEDKGESIEFTVNDDGMGVPKSEQPHLFSKFYRAGNAKKARPDGTGLGLFMAKKVIVAQGGSVIFNSQEGKGSTFGFSFPKSKLQVNPTSAAAEEPAAKPA